MSGMQTVFQQPVKSAVFESHTFEWMYDKKAKVKKIRSESEHTERQR
jgi:hypothetical protein